MRKNERRMARELKTVTAMIQLYCAGQHATDGVLCEDCAALQAYAMERLDTCPFQAGKTTCAKCPIHCYKPEMREQVRVVMRYVGPRMLLRHPFLAILNLVDGVRKEPVRAKN